MNIKERKPVLEPVPGLFKKRHVDVVEAFENKRSVTVIAKRIFRLAHTVRTLNEAEQVKKYVAGFRVLSSISNKRKRNSLLKKKNGYLTVSIWRMHDILGQNLRRSIVSKQQLSVLYSISNKKNAKKFPYMTAEEIVKMLLRAKKEKKSYRRALAEMVDILKKQRTDRNSSR